MGERFQSAAEFRDALSDLLFKVRMRVSPSDVGRISVDYLDQSPESVGRVREHVKHWELPADLLAEAAPARTISHPTPGPVVAVQAPAPISGLSAAGALAAAGMTPVPSSAPAPPPPSSRSRPRPPRWYARLRRSRIAAARAGAATAAGPAEAAPAPAANQDGIDVQVDEDGPRRGGKRKRFKIDAQTAAALDNILSQPLSVVDLDMYEAPLTPHQPGAALPPAPSSRVGPTPTGARQQVAPPPGPDITAELTAITPMRIFSDLAAATETGLLRFETPSLASELYLVRGAPESLGGQLTGQHFGDYLASRGVLRPQELKVAVAQLPNFGGKIVDAIIGLGIMKPVDVFRLLSEQVRQGVLETFGFLQGRALFFRNQRNPHESFPLGLDPFEILGAGVLSLPFEQLQRRFVVLRDLRPRAFESAAPQPRGLPPRPHTPRAVEHARRHPHRPRVAPALPERRRAAHLPAQRSTCCWRPAWPVSPDRLLLAREHERDLAGVELHAGVGVLGVVHEADLAA